jgi:hypothetical protein
MGVIGGRSCGQADGEEGIKQEEGRIDGGQKSFPTDWRTGRRDGKARHAFKKLWRLSEVFMVSLKIAAE